jgi:hypothetical protein
MRELDQCRRTWRKLGVSRADADEMAAELEADIAAAASEGHGPQTIVGADVQAFARAWAEQRGNVRGRLHLATSAIAALVGAVPGAAFGLFVAYGLSSQAMADIFGGKRIRVGPNQYETAPLSVPTWLLLALYALGAMFAYAGAVGAVALALHLRLDPIVRRTVKALAAALPFACVAAVAATVGYASTTDFSTRSHVVIADLLVAAVVFGGCVAAIRYATVRRVRLGAEAGVG